MHGYGSTWPMAGMMVGWVLLTVLLVGLVVWLVVASTRPQSAARPEVGREGETAGARRVLADRLARGELDTEEYRERLTALGG